ncbi:hypothetical protein AAFE91_001072 [Enterococcus faecium]|uniref:Uncharacterized protein n=2 Tax=Enterococcus faecium TaxID=1352 RepID=A0A5K7WH29_ENTFC|nr:MULTISPECIES: hypothetical protein [Enterococcus]HAQ1583499.1 hypothetical protein [Enterococcus faecium Efm-HS0661]EJX56270.1 hypothetical protein HMPREF1378_00089 [Enterococcus faecium R496]EJX88526.1 hypothetical protein HMPREF1368_00281 [Enterococcus faecium ERV69]EJX91253.1 hypothetical protein HMPREF1367_00801 [Enterococcus faecium ERV38]EKQ3345649.1 hypothetical protein [Enterococcus faecium]
MKKIIDQPTNRLIVEGVIFVTMYFTVGNGISNTIIQKDPQYLLFSLYAWIVQMLWVSLLMLLFYWIVRVILLVLNKAKKKKDR